SQSAAAVVTIHVTSIANAVPVANADSFSVDQDATLTKTAADGVFKNDTDAESESLTVSSVTGSAAGTVGQATSTAHGSVTLNSDGSFTYTPTSGFSGSDSFAYVASDAHGQSSPATVTITVNHVNHAPVASNDTYTTTKNTPL